MSILFKTVVLALAASTIAAPAYNGADSKSSNYTESKPSGYASSQSSGYTPSKAPSTMTTSYSSSYSSYSSIPSATAPATPPPSAADQKKLAELLKTKVLAIDREKELFVDANGAVKTGDALTQQLIFNFNTATPAAGELGGRKATANVATYPFLTGSGLSTTVAFLGPCGMNTPHVHPRGNEFLTVANNTLEFGMILENGLVDATKGTGELAGTLNAFEGALFPQGAIHYQFNPTCDTTVFVAVLSNEDAGTNQVAQGFFGLDGQVVEAAIGFQEPIDGAFVEKIRGNIPVSLAKGVESCLAKCHISKH